MNDREVGRFGRRYFFAKARKHTAGGTHVSNNWCETRRIPSGCGSTWENKVPVMCACASASHMGELCTNVEVMELSTHVQHSLPINQVVSARGLMRGQVRQAKHRPKAARFARLTRPTHSQTSGSTYHVPDHNWDMFSAAVTQ